MTKRLWTAAEVAELGVRTDLVTAASVLGLGATKAYELVRSGEFPVPVIKMGRVIVVPVAGLLKVLGLDGPVSRTDDVIDGTTW